jgi:GTPase SAR1 family protein
VWLFSPNVPPFNANEYHPPVEFVAKIKFNGNTRKAAEWLGLNSTPNPRKSNAFTAAKDYLLSLGSFRLNVVNKFIEFKKHNDDKWIPLGDIELDKIFTEIRESNITIAKESLFSIVRTLAAETLFHPFREYFENLQSPEGDPLKDFSELIKTDDEFKSLVYKYLLTFFVSAVAQSLGERGSDTMLILYGPQGVGKTTFLRHLVPSALSEFYTEISLFQVDKDLQIAAANSFLLNVDDLEKLQYKSMGYIKSLLSSSHLYYRPPYGKTLEKHWRFATFVGSVNNREFLSDHSGYRRFLVLPMVKRNLDFLDFDINKIWSFAFNFYKKNGPIYLDENSIGVLNNINSKFEVFNEEFEIISQIFQPPSNPDKAIFLTRAQIINLIKTVYPRVTVNPNNVSAALKKLGIEPIHTKRGNFFKIQICDEYENYAQDMPFKTKVGNF